MMFGTRDEFEYLECPECGTVQIADIPDLQAYYPQSYYSFEAPAASRFKEHLATAATDIFYRSRKLPIANRVFELFGADVRLIDRGLGLKSVLRLDPARNGRILDVGCGSAGLLRMLARLGFTSLTGIDKFLHEDSDRDGVKLRAAELSDLEGKFDLIMFHHSLEHMPNPVEALRQAYMLLADGGACLVRIPLLAFAWEKYGVNWVGLDPPRHLVLVTEQGARRMMTAAGFSVANAVYDSTSFQFSASEKYSLEMPLVGSGEPFSKRQMREWDVEAKRLNRERRGDQAVFVLKKDI